MFKRKGFGITSRATMLLIIMLIPLLLISIGVLKLDNIISYRKSSAAASNAGHYNSAKGQAASINNNISVDIVTHNISEKADEKATSKPEVAVEKTEDDTRQSDAGQDDTEQDDARQGNTEQDDVRQSDTGQDDARQGGTGQKLQEAVPTEEMPDKLDEKIYPKALRELFDKNAEARQFVLDFPENKNSDENIDISSEVKKGTIPHFLQWDKRWGYKKYGDDYMALTGCGPTCLSMVLCGLKGDASMNPYAVAKLADEKGYYITDSGSSWTIMSDLATELGLNARELYVDEDLIINELKEGRILICIMGPGYFTDQGHFIVLRGMDKKGRIRINDPNSLINTKKHWPVNELASQMKNVWSYTYAE